MNQNLAERLQEVINDAKEALRLCRSMDARPNIGLNMMEGCIKEAEKAQVGDDVVAMMRAVKDLEGWLQ